MDKDLHGIIQQCSSIRNSDEANTTVSGINDLFRQDPTIDPNALTDGGDGSSTLHLVSQSGSPRDGQVFLERIIIEALVRHGANVNVLDRSGRTPLIVAAIHDNASATRALLANNADPFIKDNFGLTALFHSAARNVEVHDGNSTEVANILVQSYPTDELLRLDHIVTIKTANGACVKCRGVAHLLKNRGDRIYMEVVTLDIEQHGRYLILTANPVTKNYIAVVKMEDLPETCEINKLNTHCIYCKEPDGSVKYIDLLFGIQVFQIRTCSVQSNKIQIVLPSVIQNATIETKRFSVELVKWIHEDLSRIFVDRHPGETKQWQFRKFEQNGKYFITNNTGYRNSFYGFVVGSSLELLSLANFTVAKQNELAMFPNPASLHQTSKPAPQLREDLIRSLQQLVYEGFLNFLPLCGGKVGCCDFELVANEELKQPEN